MPCRRRSGATIASLPHAPSTSIPLIDTRTGSVV